MTTLKARLKARHKTLAQTPAPTRPAPDALARRQALAARPLEWLQYYAADEFPAPFGQLHYEMLPLLHLRGELTLIEVARSHGKSTLLRGYIKYLIAEGREPYITYMAHDMSLATQYFNELRRWFTSPRVLEDYGDLRGDQYGLQWTQRGAWFCDYATPRPYAQVFCRFLGLDTILRGATAEAQRIGWLVVDDPVKGYVEAHSFAHTTKVLHLLQADALFAGGSSLQERQIAVTVLGTPQAEQDVIGTLARDPMTVTYRLPGIALSAAEQEALLADVSAAVPALIAYRDQVLQQEQRALTHAEQYAFCAQTPTLARWLAQPVAWPGLWDMAAFLFLAAKNTVHFAQEILLHLGNPALQQVRREWFQEYTTLSDDTLRHAVGCLSVDPSRGAGDVKQHDPSALVAKLYVFATQETYWLQVQIDWFTPRELGEALLAMWDAPLPGNPAWRLCDVPGMAIVLETNQYQIAVRDILELLCEQQSRAIPPLVLRDTTQNKMEKLLEHRPYLEQRKTFALAHDPQHALLIDQWVHFSGTPTHGAMDVRWKLDGPDADVMGHQVLVQAAPPGLPAPGEPLESLAPRPGADRSANPWIG